MTNELLRCTTWGVSGEWVDGWVDVWAFNVRFTVKMWRSLLDRWGLQLKCGGACSTVGEAGHQGISVLLVVLWCSQYNPTYVFPYVGSYHVDT